MNPEKQKTLNEREVAAILGVSMHTVRHWRFHTKKLPFIKEGRFIKYKREDVDALKASRIPSPAGRHPVVKDTIQTPAPQRSHSDHVALYSTLMDGLVIRASELLGICQRVLGISKHLNELADEVKKTRD